MERGERGPKSMKQRHRAWEPRPNPTTGPCGLCNLGQIPEPLQPHGKSPRLTEPLRKRNEYVLSTYLSLYYPHYRDGTSEVQRGEDTCPGRHKSSFQISRQASWVLILGETQAPKVLHKVNTPASSAGPRQKPCRVRRDPAPSKARPLGAREGKATAPCPQLPQEGAQRPVPVHCHL